MACARRFHIVFIFRILGLLCAALFATAAPSSGAIPHPTTSNNNNNNNKNNNNNNNNNNNKTTETNG